MMGDMTELLLTEGFAPFTLALALLMGLLALELVFALLGGTLFGAGAEGVDTPDLDGPDMDIDLDVDLDGFDLDSLDLDSLDLDGMDIDGADMDAPEIDAPDGTNAATGGIAAWLGFGKMPAAIWLASVLMAFGLSGVMLQMAASSVLGAPFPALVASLPAAVVALWFARQFGALFARLIPKTETQALSERHLGRRRGIVSQGTAARGKPAEVRVTDRYGNTHYLRAEPLNDDAVIPQGSDVLVMRARHDGTYRLVPLNA